jgi:Uma2 family endonuclease
MGMPHASAIWTADRVRALPDDGKRYEVIDGALLVTPAPGWPHQRAIRGLFRLLDPYVQAHQLGEALWSPADIELDTRTLVQPDLFVTQIAAGEPGVWQQIDLRLVVEVLSPSTARYDRLTKRALYQRHGIEYWIVDLDARVIERWGPLDERPEILAAALQWQPAGAASPLIIDLERFFAEVLDRP